MSSSDFGRTVEEESIATTTRGGAKKPAVEALSSTTTRLKDTCSHLSLQLLELHRIMDTIESGDSVVARELWSQMAPSDKRKNTGDGGCVIPSPTAGSAACYSPGGRRSPQQHQQQHYSSPPKYLPPIDNGTGGLSSPQSPVSLLDSAMSFSTNHGPPNDPKDQRVSELRRRTSMYPQSVLRLLEDDSGDSPLKDEEMRASITEVEEQTRRVRQAIRELQTEDSKWNYLLDRKGPMKERHSVEGAETLMENMQHNHELELKALQEKYNFYSEKRRLTIETIENVQKPKIKMLSECIEERNIPQVGTNGLCNLDTTERAMTHAELVDRIARRNHTNLKELERAVKRQETEQQRALSRFDRKIKERESDLEKLKRHAVINKDDPHALQREREQLVRGGLAGVAAAVGEATTAPPHPSEKANRQQQQQQQQQQTLGEGGAGSKQGGGTGGTGGGGGILRSSAFQKALHHFLESEKVARSMIHTVFQESIKVLRRDMTMGELSVKRQLGEEAMRFNNKRQQENKRQFKEDEGRTFKRGQNQQPQQQGKKKKKTVSPLNQRSARTRSNSPQDANGSEDANGESHPRKGETEQHGKEDEAQQQAGSPSQQRQQQGQKDEEAEEKTPQESEIEL